MEKKSRFLKNSLLIKGLFIVITALVLQIPILMVTFLVSDRQEMSNNASVEIANSWGGPQTFTSPYLSIPYYASVLEGQKTVKHALTRVKQSDEARLDGNVDVQMRKRAIYEFPVYTADMTIEGSFLLDKSDIECLNGKVTMCLPLSQTKGVEGRPTAVVNGKEYQFDMDANGLIIKLDPADVTVDTPVEYTIHVKSRGKSKLCFNPKADNFDVSLSSNYDSPGFNGQYLPVSREVSDDGFVAKWNVTKLNSFNVNESTFHVDLIVPADHYLQTERSIKYSFLVILLVLMGIFLAEVITRTKVNIVQYIVTGLSLCLFYLLLLSISEYISFGFSYLIASVMTTAALGGYFYGFLKSKMALIFTLIVAVLYGFIYVILQMETGSLLVGTLALFAILGVVMYFTRNANLFEPKQPAVIE